MRRKWNRPLAALLAACMLFSLLPAAAAVETAEEVDNSSSTVLPEKTAPVEDGNENQETPATDENADSTTPDSSSEEETEPDSPPEQEVEAPEVPAEPVLPLEPEGDGENPLPAEEEKEENPPLEEDQKEEPPAVLPAPDQILEDVVNDAGNGAADGLLEFIDLPAVFSDTAESYEYILDTDGIDSGSIYAIYTNVESIAYNRILYHTGTGQTDKVPSTGLTDNQLLLHQNFPPARQIWIITAVEGGYTVKSVDSGRYLDLTAPSAKNINTSESAVVLEIEQNSDGTYTISKDGGSALAFNPEDVGGKGYGNIYAGTEAASLRLFKQTPAGEEPEVPDGVLVTNANGGTITAVDGVYIIPADGRVYVGEDTEAAFTVPMGVKEIRISAGKAGELTLGEVNGEIAAIEGMTVVMPNGETAAELVGSGLCGDHVYYALVKDEDWTSDSPYTRMHISGSGPMWDMYTSPDYANTFPNGHLRPYQSLAINVKSAKVYEGVTTIGNYAFYNTSSGSGARFSGGIELPSTLTTIGREAFTNVRMPEITIPEGVTTIGVRAFYNAGQPYKKGIGANPDIPARFVPTLPGTLTELGESVFSNSNLTEITVPQGVKQIPSMAFHSCKYLEQVTILGAEAIGPKAFGASGTYTTSTIQLSLPETLTTIQDQAFNNAKVRSLTIPASVTTISGSSVFGSQLGNLRFLGVPGSISEKAFQTQLTKAMVVYVPDAQAVEQLRNTLSTINGTYYVANLNGHDTTLSTLYTGYLFAPLKNGAASSWYDEAGNAVEAGTYYTQIPNGTVSGTVFTAGTTESAVRAVTADGEKIAAVDGVYTIPAGGRVMTGDEVLFTVPMGVAHISIPEAKAEDLTLSDTGAIAAIDGMTLSLPDGSTAASLTKSGHCGKTENDLVYFAATAEYKVVISGRGSMKDYPGYNSANPFGYTVQEVVITEGVTSVGEWAFYGKACTSVILPDGLLKIGAHAFDGCSSITSIVIPDSVTTVGVDAFKGCSKIERIDFPAGMTAVPASLFSSGIPTHLYRVTFAGAVDIVGSGAFTHGAGARSSLGTVLFQSSPQTVAANAFSGLTANSVIYTQGAPSASMKAAVKGYLADLNGGSISDEVFNTLQSARLPKTLTHSDSGLKFQGWRASSDNQLVTIQSQWSDLFDISSYPQGTVFTAQWECLDHTWGDWEVTTPAACTTLGAKTHTCSACGKTETEEIPALNHDLVSHAAQDATCTEAGWHAFETCNRCDYSGKVEIAALGHDLVSHAAQDATCTEAGWHAFETCNRCDYSGKVEIAALGHTPKPIPAVQPTYDQTGLTEGEECSVCGVITKEQETIPALTRPSTGGSRPRPTPPVVEIEDPDTPLVELPFEDVESDAWYKEAIDYVYSKNLMQGSSEDGFAPDVKTDRGTMAKVLYNLAGGTGAGSVELSFPDVVEGVQDVEAIYWAASHGLVVGYDNGNFGPRDNVTREQMAVMLYRYAQFQNMDVTVEGDVLKDFTDSESIGDWSREALAWAVSRRLLSGRDDGRMAPGDNATRAEVAAVVMRFHQMLEKDSAAD